MLTLQNEHLTGEIKPNSLWTTNSSATQMNSLTAHILHWDVYVWRFCGVAQSLWFYILAWRHTIVFACLVAILNWVKYNAISGKKRLKNNPNQRYFLIESGFSIWYLHWRFVLEFQSLMIKTFYTINVMLLGLGKQKASKNSPSPRWLPNPWK